jgi:hypothetical protein
MKHVGSSFLLVTVLSACAPNETILRSNSPTPIPAATRDAPTQSGDAVQREIEYMRTADFEFVFVLRRRDGLAIQPEDRAFIRSVTSDANRRAMSEDGMAVVVGSNYRLPPKVTTPLMERFDVQDFSKPEKEFINSNKAANANMVR